mgnify:CR=1 FL=1
MLKKTSSLADYQVIIIGGGPAGLTAGLYTCRSRLKTLLIERGLLGGQITEADKVENYPGFPEGISGIDLGERMAEQARHFGLEVLSGEVTAVDLAGEWKGVDATVGSYRGRSVIIASGGSHRKLGVVGETELLGRGVSYCATCDGPLFRDQEVAVVGGGDTAVADALYLTQFVKKVFLVHRRSELKAAPVLQERAQAEPKLGFLWNKVVQAIRGQERVEGLELAQVTSKEKSYLPVTGVFVAIGLHPATSFLEGKLSLTPDRRVPTNEFMETEVRGVFAAGDVRHNALGQVVSAAGDGAMAAITAYRYLRGG